MQKFGAGLYNGCSKTNLLQSGENHILINLAHYLILKTCQKDDTNTCNEIKMSKIKPRMHSLNNDLQAF
jgi:hypothetical protein